MLPVEIGPMADDDRWPRLIHPDQGGAPAHRDHGNDGDREMRRLSALGLLPIWRLIFVVFTLGTFTVAGSLADVSPAGIWTRDNGGLQVRVSRCGASLCGVIIREDDKTSPARVGHRVFSGMTPNGPNAWKGTAYNPGNGKSYNGTMLLSGNTLTTSGCVLGLICESVTWTRGK